MLSLLVNVLLSYTIADPAIPDLAELPSPAIGIDCQPSLWEPMEGSPAVVESFRTRRVIQMHCPFEKEPRIPRASWDLKPASAGKKSVLDLSRTSGLEFKIFAADRSSVSNFSLYLRSGAGWYSYRFAPKSKTGWSTIHVLKEDTKLEGRPEGWSRIDLIRLSAWRGENRNAEFFVADFGFSKHESDVFVVRGESAIETNPTEANSISQYSKSMADMLRHIGVNYSLISDRDLNPTWPGKDQVVILPHNPGMSPTTTTNLKSFLNAGGKLMAFYSLSQALLQSVGMDDGEWIGRSHPGQFAFIAQTKDGLKAAPAKTGQRSWNIKTVKPIVGRSRIASEWLTEEGKPSGYPAIVASENCIYMSHVLLTDDLRNKQSLLLAMLGYLRPAVWDDAVARKMQQLDSIGPFKNMNEAIDSIRQDLNDRDVSVLTDALFARSQARRLAEEGQHRKALDSLSAYESKLIEAYCRSKKSAPGEFRGFWCHRAQGPVGMSWDESIKRLAENGFTAIIPNMLWGGVAYYPSKVLPVASDVTAQGDQIRLCLDAAKKHGIECHIWKVNWNMSNKAPATFVAQMKKADRTQVAFDGTLHDTWLCPSHPENQQLEIDAMLEVARNYDVDGLHFDYIRYPNNNHCFCNGCRTRFETATKTKLKNWPADTRSDPEVQTAWLNFRRANITHVVKKVSEQARKIRPGIKLSAAVFRNWSVDRDSVGQDWKLWCDEGYLDFVCPMDYTDNLAQLENWVTTQQQLAGKVPCYPGIGLSLWDSSTAIGTLIDQIELTRRLGTHGYTIFDYQARLANGVVPLCGMGITRATER